MNKDTSGMDCAIYNSVNTYLKETLRDYSSYQPVSFAEFSEVRSKEADKIAVYLSDKGYNDGKNRNPKNDSLANEWRKMKPVGFTIKHKFRAKNGFGVYGLETDEFSLDTLFKVMSADKSDYMADKQADIDRRMKLLQK
ncbi:hypothetical protein [Mucilaginibacter sp. FT3.2]|uniref:hypothetical protein n=1 Tax=Mucilaginibacter sp. FT3.2 TaxID=2723090 RepID=UPI00161CF95E|nr:hypothetical protein [Mucilaginibacter sp. FT3.2]MBB6234511.1 hypothetical protein [Mucilaginibacter sp. FT3.2]